MGRYICKLGLIRDKDSHRPIKTYSPGTMVSVDMTPSTEELFYKDNKLYLKKDGEYVEKKFYKQKGGDRHYYKIYGKYGWRGSMSIDSVKALIGDIQTPTDDAVPLSVNEHNMWLNKDGELLVYSKKNPTGYYLKPSYDKTRSVYTTQFEENGKMRKWQKTIPVLMFETFSDYEHHRKSNKFVYRDGDIRNNRLENLGVIEGHRYNDEITWLEDIVNI